MFSENFNAMQQSSYRSMTLLSNEYTSILDINRANRQNIITKLNGQQDLFEMRIVRSP